MKQETKASPRAIALLLAAVALPATPALAQDVAPLPTAAQPAPVVPSPVAPPPVVRTAPQPAPTATPPSGVAPPPVVRTAPSETAAAPTEAARPTQRSANRARPAAAPVRRAAPTTAAAPVAVAAIPDPAPAPVAAPVTPTPAEPTATAPTEAAAPAQVQTASPLWPWLLGGIALLAALIGATIVRRRRAAARENFYYEEDAYQPPYEDAVVAEPAFAEAAVAVLPVTEPAIEQVSVAESAPEEIDAVVAAAEPIAERPWIELGMRPVRAGTQDDDAVVEFELTVANAGSVAAQDVRISTWMFSADPAQSENERMLIDAPADSTLTQMDLAPGDGRTVDAAIALPKAGLHRTHGVAGDSFVPVVGAEARYRLPDGSEGLISASFAIGVSQGDGEAMAPFAVDGAPDMQENVEARLYGALERA